MQGDEDATIPYSLFSMLYSSPETEAIPPQTAKKHYGEGWEAQRLPELEEELANTEHSFDFTEFLVSQPSSDHDKLYENYGNHLRQRHKETNGSATYTSQIMNHLYQHIQYLYLNDELTHNTHLARELTTHLEDLAAQYHTHNFLKNIIDLHEVQADTYMMIGAAEARTDLLEKGLEEIRKAQAYRELSPATRNIKGVIYQYLASMSDTERQIQENINKSIFQFEKALENEFEHDYVQNYLQSFQLVEEFDLQDKEEYYKREISFLQKLQEKYPDAEIGLDDAEYDD